MGRLRYRGSRSPEHARGRQWDHVGEAAQARAGARARRGSHRRRHEDELRWRAEVAARAERRLRTTVHELVRQSLLDGHEHAVILDGAALGVQVLADQGHETYVAIRIIGSVPDDSSQQSSASFPAASLTHGCPTTLCPNEQ